MKHIFKTFSAAIVAALALAIPLHAQQILYPNGNGGTIGQNPQQPVGFHGKQSVQRKGIAQGALAVTPATGTITITGTPTAQVYAFQVLTLPVLPTAGDTVTIGSTTWTFQTTFSGTANQVLIAGDTADTLENLVGAILYSNTGGQLEGTTYISTGTVANTQVRAALTGQGASLTAFSLASGTSSNTIATTSSFTSGSNSWGASTLTGGAAGDYVVINGGTYTFATWLNPAVANLVLDSGTAGSAANLIAAINATPGLAGVSYSAATVSGTSVVASSGTAPNIVDLSALLSGTAENAYALTASGTTHLTLSGSGTLLGGTQFTDTNAEANLLNELRASMVQKGLIKGSN